MSICRRFTATIAMSFQLILTGFGVLTGCLDRPHTHAGVPALDCAMHHPPAVSSPAAAEHHHHGAHQAPAPDTAQLQCRCSSDLMSLLVGDAAALPDVASVARQRPSAALNTFAPTPIDLSAGPTSPPPRFLPV